MKYIKLTPLLFLLFIACSKDSPTSPTPNNVLMPLTIGNYWKYADIDSTRFTDKVQYYTIRVNRDTIINGIKFFITKRDTGSFDYEYLYLNKENGLYTFNGSINPSLAYKYPVQVGESFNIGFDSNFTNIKVIAIDKYVKTSAGNFKCIQYQIKDTLSMTNERGEIIGKYYYTQNTYYSLGIGLIQEDEETIMQPTNQQSYSMKWQKVLVEYSVK